MQLKVDRFWVIKDENGDVYWGTRHTGSREACILQYVRGLLDPYAQYHQAETFWKQLVCDGCSCVEMAVAELPAGATIVNMSVECFGNYEHGKL